MNRKNICEICTLIMGQSPDSKSYNKDKNGIPFYQGNADFGEKHPTPTVWCTAPKKIARKGDILISVRAPIGDMNIANEDCCIGRGLEAIRLNKSDIVDINYLYHYLSATVEFLQEQGTGSTFKAINKTTLEGIEIPCPSIEKQKNIAKFIIEIKTSIQYKKAELVALNELVKSRFIEMFVEKGFKEITFSDYAEIIDGDRGKNYPKAEEFSDEGYCLFLSAKNVTKDGFLFEQMQFISEEKDNLLRKGKLCRGDIVITTRGTIGNIAFYDDDIPYDNVRINSGMVIIRQKEVSFNQIFFLNAFKNKIDEIKETNVTGAAQPQLPIHIMSKIKLLNPPIELQNEFADFVKLIDKSKFVGYFTLNIFYVKSSHFHHPP